MVTTNKMYAFLQLLTCRNSAQSQSVVTFSVWGNLRNCVWDRFWAYCNQSYYTSVFLLVLQSEDIVFPREAVLCAGIVGCSLIPSSLPSPSSVQLVYDILHGLLIVWGYVPYETHIMVTLKRMPLAFQHSQVLHIFQSNFWSEGPRVQRCVGWLMPSPSLMWTICNGLLRSSSLVRGQSLGTRLPLHQSLRTGLYMVMPLWVFLGNENTGDMRMNMAVLCTQ